MKDQVTDEKKLGAKITEGDKKVIMDAVADAQKWSDAHKESASKEDIEEQKAKVEKLVAPIMTKLYEAGAASAPTDESATPEDHDEL